VKVVEDQVQQGNREAADGLYDAVGALYVLHPALFTLIPQKVHIDFSEGKKGRIVPDPREAPSLSRKSSTRLQLTRAPQSIL